jgi:hypothetical protein
MPHPLSLNNLSLQAGKTLTYVFDHLNEIIMKTLLYLLATTLLLTGNISYAAAPPTGTTNFNALTTSTLLAATASPGAVSNVGASGWNFTVASPGGNVSMSINGAGVTGVSDICIRLNRLTVGLSITSTATQSNDGSPFRLNHVYLKVTLVAATTADMVLTGYNNGAPVPGAVKTITGITSTPTWTNFDVSAMTAFNHIDEFRFTQAGTTTAQIGIAFIDEIDIATPVPLPLTLGNFSGQRQDNTVTLDWTTLMEQNTARFEIQRTENAASYQTIGTIQAAGNSALPLNYEFIDNLPVAPAAQYYYRLKMIDLDDRYTYSPIVILNGPNSPFTFSAYPNPLQNTTTLTATSPSAGNAQLTVTDMAGRQLLTRPIYLQKGSNTFPLPFFGGWQKGIYIVQLVSRDQRQTIRLLKTE